MTLPANGLITLTGIATEYEDLAPHSLTEFYGKPDLPESGELKVSNFYGKSAYVAPPEPKTLSIIGTVVLDPVNGDYFWHLNNKSINIAGMTNVMMGKTHPLHPGQQVFVYEEDGIPENNVWTFFGPPQGTIITASLTNNFTDVEFSYDNTVHPGVLHSFRPVIPGANLLSVAGAQQLVITYFEEVV